MSDEATTSTPPVELTITPVHGLDMSVRELVQRLAETGTRIQFSLDIQVQTGTGIYLRFVGYPVPRGFRLETHRLNGCPPEYFAAVVRAAGFEPHREDSDRCFLTIELPPV